jgi:kynurenine formamidase
MPVYPHTTSLQLKQEKNIETGNSCNTFVFTLSSHTGTHVDAPAHFYRDGKRISEYSIDELIFQKPVILNCPKEPREAISVSDLSSLRDNLDCDLVLLRTGFSQYRDKNTVRYCQQGPYLEPEAALWLRTQCAHIKALGIDAISVSSFANRDAGRKTHLTLLSESGFPSSAVLIIEDMLIPDGINDLIDVFVVPLFLNGIDSSPCTVIGTCK